MRADAGAGTLEYSALVCVAAVLLVALMVPLHDRITPYVRWGLCVVFTGFAGGHCEPPEEAAGRQGEQETPCVVDTRTTTGGGSLYLPWGGGIEGSNSTQRRSDGSLWVTMTLTGKIGLALGDELDDSVKVGFEGNVTGAISMKLTFKDQGRYDRFRKEVRNREVDAVAAHLPGHSGWLAKKALKYGKYIAAPLLIKIYYDAIMDTVHGMNVPNIVGVSYGLKGSQSVTGGPVNVTGTGSVATTKGTASDGTGYRSYTVELSGAGNYNLVPSAMLPEGVSIAVKYGAELKGTFTILVSYGKDGRVTKAKAILRLQGDLTEAVGGGGSVSGRYIGASGSLELNAKEGAISVISKDLDLSAQEKAVLDVHKDDIEPKRSAYYLTEIGKALYHNRDGEYRIQVYDDLQAGAKASGSVNVLTVDVVQGSVSASLGREHLVRAYNYDPDGGGLRHDEQCAKAA